MIEWNWKGVIGSADLFGGNVNTFICILVAFFFTLSAGCAEIYAHPHPQQAMPKITWYTGGKGKLDLKQLEAGKDPWIDLAGVTSGKTLIIKVTKSGGAPRSNPIPLDTNGSFNVRYLLKDGPGTYTVTLFGSDAPHALSYQGLGAFTMIVAEPLAPHDRTLELNPRIISFVNKVLGKTVGRGECWDLAQQALDANLADWSRPTSFGIPLNPAVDTIKAGDIIQFRSVILTEELPHGGRRVSTVGAPDHTAVIYNVVGKLHYTLAQQNVGGNRSVITEKMNLGTITGGHYQIYRPTALMIQKAIVAE